MSAARSDVLAWHYTTGEKFVKIVASGYLMPTGVLVQPPERPVLWFSLNQRFEPTAQKAVIEGGAMRILSVEETGQLCGGLVRFGMSPRKLLTGDKLRTRARIARPFWAGLCRAGVRQKADPAHWLGCLDAVPVDRLVIEVMNDAGEWERVQGAAA
jgi:hypothetical protein